MNFRLAEKSDKQQLYRLWESAFGDCESDIDCFFDGVLEKVSQGGAVFPVR